jgi:hypothetical protein
MVFKRLVVLSVLVILVISFSGIASAKVYSAAAFSGEPVVEKKLGYRVWHDQAGWHIRWSTYGNTRDFSGSIECNRPIESLHRLNLEPNDRVIRKPRMIRFNCRTANGVDGIDFNTDGDYLVLHLRIDGTTQRDLIHIGRYGWHPDGQRIVIKQ